MENLAFSSSFSRRSGRAGPCRVVFEQKLRKIEKLGFPRAGPQSTQKEVRRLTTIGGIDCATATLVFTRKQRDLKIYFRSSDQKSKNTHEEIRVESTGPALSARKDAGKLRGIFCFAYLQIGACVGVIDPNRAASFCWSPIGVPSVVNPGCPVGVLWGAHRADTRADTELHRGLPRLSCGRPQGLSVRTGPFSSLPHPCRPLELHVHSLPTSFQLPRGSCGGVLWGESTGRTQGTTPPCGQPLSTPVSHSLSVPFPTPFRPLELHVNSLPTSLQRRLSPHPIPLHRPADGACTLFTPHRTPPRHHRDRGGSPEMCAPSINHGELLLL